MRKWFVLALGLSLGCFPFFPLFSQEQGDISPSVPPGVYRSDVLLAVTLPSPSYQLFYRFTDSMDPSFASYRVPILLKALPGEDRKYEIHYRLMEGNRVVREGRELYRIDKKAPPLPAPSPESGEYVGKCSITFPKERDIQIWVALYRRGEKPVFSLWKGEPIVLESGPEPEQVTLLYYAQDPAGNQSAVGSRVYSLRPALPPPDSFLHVRSPVEGLFLNPQPLWIESRGYEWIRYRVNNSAPLPYQKPVVLNQEGTVKIEITAKKLHSAIIETRTVQLRQEFKQTALPNLSFHKIEEEVTLSFPKGTYRYNLEDRPVQPYDPELPERLSLFPLAGHTRVTVFRLKPLSLESEGEYRYVVELAGEEPGEVGIQVKDPKVYREKTIVTLAAKEGAQIHYTIDGSLPNQDSPVYEGPFELSFPPQSEGYVTLRARARLNGRWGPVSESFIEYDTAPPPAPNPKITFNNPSGQALIELSPVADGEGIFEIAWGNQDPPKPSLLSPRMEERAWVRCPYGYAGTAKLRIAYRDRAGNITEHPQVITLSFDRLPPPPPRLGIKERQVSMEGEGRLFYRIQETTGSLDVSLIPGGGEGEAFSLYGKPFELPAPEGLKVVYNIEGYAQDEAGNRSETSFLKSVTFDRRVPTTVVSIPKPPKGIDVPITNTEYVLTFQDPKGDLELFYTYTEDGTEPPNPTTSSLKGGAQLRFQGQAGKRILYTLKVWARYRGSLETGQVQTYRFVVDREPPQLPKVEGGTPRVRNRGAFVRFVPNDPEDRIFYRIVKEGKGRDAEESDWIPYTDPISLDTEEGTETSFSISYRVVDQASNTVEAASPLKIVIDKKPPQAPEAVVGKGIVLKSAEGVIHYETSLDGSLPPLPSVGSAVYQREIPLTFKDTPFVSLAARCRDEAGNWGPVLYLADLPTLPFAALPPVPAQIIHLQDIAVLSWEEQGETMVEGIDPADGQRIKTFKNPSFVDGKKGREILLTRKDRKGAKSEAVTIKVLGSPPGVPIRITGGEKGEYPRGVQLRSLEEGAILRYEISTGPIPPRRVDILSPRMERPVMLDVLAEETVLFRVQVQNFSKSNVPVSPVQEFTIRIDRTPPPPPEISGVEPGGSYGEDVTVSLRGKEGALFYYLFTTAEGQPAPPVPEERQFKPYEKPIPTSVSEGSSKLYWIHAFSRDSVGNTSRPVRTWSFLVDKQYLYVVEGKGGQGSGTRSNPFTSLETALEQALKGSRSRIRVASGTYTLNKPLNIRKDVTLLGGLDRNGWKPGSGTSKVVWNPASFKGLKTDAYLTVEQGTVKLDNLSFEGGDGSGKTFFAVRGANLELTQCSATVTGKDRVLEQKRGKVAIDHSVFNSPRFEGDALATVGEGSFVARKTSLSYERSEGGGSLVKVVSSDVFLDSVTLQPGTGETTLGIDSENSTVKVQFSTIHTGAGTLAAYGIRLRQGSLNLQRSEITYAPNAYISVAVGLFQAKGEVLSTTITIGGRYGAQALHVRGSELTLRESLLQGDRTEDYLYYGTLEDSTLKLEGNVMRRGTSAEVTGFQLINSRLEGEKNTLEFGQSNRGFSGFILQGKSDLVLKGNDISAPDPRGVLFVLPSREDISVEVTENRFSVQGGYREIRQGGRRVLLRNLKDLEASSRAKVRFQRNQSAL